MMKLKNTKKPVLLKRQDFLKGMVAAPFVVSCLPSALKADASKPSAKGKNLGFLYDSTKCIGCRACTSSCHKANDMPPISHDKPIDLSERSRTTIKVFMNGPNKKPVFMKKQCNHCQHPSCVSACPVNAMLQDEKTGIVYNDPDTCTGCRYCMVACPFDVIQFEWDSSTPRIIKCEMCKDNYLQTDGTTACVDVCPSGALIFDNRKNLIKEANKRIKKSPKKYNSKIYGLQDGGKLNILYLTGQESDFSNLGFPANLGNESPAAITESIQAIYTWFIAPVVAFALLFVPVSKNFSKQAGEENDVDKG